MYYFSTLEDSGYTFSSNCCFRSILHILMYTVLIDILSLFCNYGFPFSFMQVLFKIVVFNFQGHSFFRVALLRCNSYTVDVERALQWFSVCSWSCAIQGI